MDAIRLTLFIAGSSARSERAVANLRRICDSELGDAYELEIVDVLLHPDRAEAVKILATPTLLKQAPPPERRIVGDLSSIDHLVEFLASDADVQSGGITS